MWYVVQVVGGRERRALDQVRGVCDPATFKQCFLPQYEVKKRYGGVWQMRREILFPGYVFVETKTPEAFRVELGRVCAATKLLTGGTVDGERRFIPLTDAERVLISSFIGDDDHVMKMSEGIIEGDEIMILRGPLMNHVGLVRKIDRHKRLAYLEMDMCGRKVGVRAGLEIIRKS